MSSKAGGIASILAMFCLARGRHHPLDRLGRSSLRRLANSNSPQRQPGLDQLATHIFLCMTVTAVVSQREAAVSPIAGTGLFHREDQKTTRSKALRM